MQDVVFDLEPRELSLTSPKMAVKSTEFVTDPEQA